MKQKLMIGISGKMGSGKSTISNLLKEAWESAGMKVEKLSVAAPIYNGQDLLYKEYGLQLEGAKDRDLLIAIGLWGRSKDPDFWLNQLAKMAIDSEADIIICDDVRFENEAKFFDKVGFLIRLEGDQRGDNIDPSRANHPTECDLDGYSFKHIVSNRQSPNDMCAEIGDMLKGDSDEKAM